MEAYSSSLVLDMHRANPLTMFAPYLSYLIDFEISRYDKDYKPTSWEDLVSPLDHPDAILQQWGLETRELRERLNSFRTQRRNGEQSQSAGREQSRSATQSACQSQGGARAGGRAETLAKHK